MIAAIIVVAVADILFLTAIWLIFRKGVRFRTIGLRFIAGLSIAIAILCFLFAFTSPNLPLWALLSLATGCLVFLSSCLGAWLSDKQLAFVERQRAERPEFREAMEKNLILRTVWRLGRWQRKD